MTGSFATSEWPLVLGSLVPVAPFLVLFAFYWFGTPKDKR